MKYLCLIFGTLTILAGHLPAQETKAQPIYYVNPEWSPDGSTIVFESTRDGKEAVYTIQVDGSGLRQLTSGESNPSGQPRWSSDGRQIVFISSREGREGLFLMNADGSQQRRLTNTTIGGDFVPVLSPNGDQVAFVSSEDEKTRTTDISVIRTDGTGRRRLTNCEESVCGGAQWSPDGEKILFGKGLAMPKNFPSLSSEERTQVKARVQNSGDIFIMDKDGSHVRNLTNNNFANHHARWSKDGKTIYFVSQREGTPNVYAMNADGSNVRKVADGMPRGDASPDGKYLVYSKQVDQKSGIYIYETKSGTERLLISGPAQQPVSGAQQPVNQPVIHGGAPVVSPDGSRIAFISNRAGNDDVFVISADGTGEIQLTHTPEDESDVGWTADGRQILFSTTTNDTSYFYSIDLNGKNQREISRVPGRGPKLSPDGKRLLYMAGTWTATRLMVASVDGSNAQQITAGTSIAWNNHWSPDGNRIAFTGQNDSGKGLAVFVMNADGTGRSQVTHLTPEEGRAQLPAWSSDGRQLAFQASVLQTHSSHIWIVDVATGVAHKLAAHDQPYLDEAPSWFLDGKRIAFQSNRTGRMEVWVMNADGSGQRQVTGAQPTPAAPPLVFGGDPRVSPDGSRILFGSNRTGVSQLYVMNVDGTNTRQITTGSSGAFSGRWSPDGKLIVYYTRAANLDQIVIVNADGTERHVVSEAKGNQSPSWSPDGSKILFAAGEFPNINIYTMKADGSDRRNISPNPGFDYDPAWSPAGRTIAVVTAIRGQGPRVWLMNADGSGRRRVTTSVDAEERPAWSLDGRYLAFQSSKRGDGPHEAYVHVVEISSGADSRLGTHDHPYLDETPSWFPDGKHIAFQSDRTGRMEVWVMNVDGMGQRQVIGAQQPAPKPVDNGGYPRVSPRGESILFASNRDGTRRLYLMDAAGGAARALTAPGVKVSYGEWLPSGDEIAYVVPNGEAKGIHILSLKTGVDSLVPNTDGAQGVSPSPDGRRLVFAGRVGKEIELHLINRDGSGDQVITSEPRFHSYPAWSPDGKEIAFTRGTSDGPKIFVMNVDGSNIRRVSALSVLEEVPAWSPDGRRLAFQGAVRDQHIAHLYIATVDGREVTQVTNQSEPYLTETPSWFPDGKRIAFQSDRTGRMEVWVMNADGTEQRQVTGAQPPPAAPLIVGGDPRVPPDGSPGPCAAHQLVYDDKLKMVLMVNCGETAPGLKGKLWGWNGSRWAAVSSNAPPTRVLGGAAYDSRRNMLVLYGGFEVVEGRPTPTSETWEWDGSRWTKRDVAPPDVTDHFAMTFDGARAKVVLHGGQGPDGVGKGGTWIWDGKRWEKASNTGPGPEAHHSLAYDSSKKKVLLFGGHQPQDFWEWDGTTWKDWENDKPRARRQQAHSVPGQPQRTPGSVGDERGWIGSAVDYAVRSNRDNAKSYEK